MRTMPIRCPYRAPRHRPIAAAAQDVPTVKNRTMAHRPMAMKPVCALGLRRHIGSRKLFGNRDDKPAIKQINEPMIKKMLKAVIPRGRFLGSNIIDLEMSRRRSAPLRPPKALCRLAQDGKHSV